MPAIKDKPAEALAEELSDDYLALVRRRPLRPIRDDEDFDAAVEFLYRADYRGLPDHVPNQGVDDYLETLTMLILDYDEKHGEWPLPREVSLGERLEEMMNDYKVDLPRLAEVAGIGREEMDEVMAGRATLSAESAKRLAAEYGCDEDFLL